MKRITTVLFIGIIFSLHSYCSAQVKQEKLYIDYKYIKEYVTNKKEDFQKLMQRFEMNDTLLTRQEYAMIYYGYSFTPDYQGSMYDMLQDYQDFKRLISENKYEEAYNAGTELLKKNPVSLQTLYEMGALVYMQNKDQEKMRSYTKRYAALITTIASSGDGKTEETAFKVICVNDEYQLLNKLFQMENMKQQSLTDNKCDLIEFDKCKYYEGTQMYFDISRSLDYMSELFGK